MKEKEINEELEKLRRIFEGLTPEVKKLTENLVQNAAFMAVTLQELQKEVLEKGAVVTGMSGNGYETTRDNPAQKAYTTMISRYASVIDQLSKYLPDDSKQKASDLLDWIEKN